MTSISYTKGNNQHVYPREPETKQKEEDVRYSIKNSGYREEELLRKSDGKPLAGVV